MTTTKIAPIRLDGGTQPRLTIDPAIVDEYAEAMEGGAEFPPITVFRDSKKVYWLADGFTRLHAARQIGRTEIEAEVLAGELEDARWYSYSANKSHGLRRTNADKQRAVEAALAHPKSKGLSDRQIAEHVGVSQPMVSGYRKQNAATDNGYQSLPVRTGRDGRTIDTSNIGKRRPRKPNPPPQPAPAPGPSSYVEVYEMTQTKHTDIVLAACESLSAYPIAVQLVAHELLRRGALSQVEVANELFTNILNSAEATKRQAA